MRLYVTVKSGGKRKPVLGRRELILAQTPGNLEELITAVVATQMKELTDKQGRGELIHFLTGGAINNQRGSGKTGFGTVYNDNLPELGKALEAALLGFEDGLYKVFVRGEACQRLQEPLVLNDGDELVFIRFPMQAGSLW
ncbi:hypothetical protein [Paenibacillus typhae]|uniref:Uncharacterized protein n=1 Tax=Paenibacillus typhae TaxID=1174501 RepID=A0A1G9D3F1_9BACL|nr:hypothetical protein [Paenibacillus typhae]SDK58397.1 hypothetical protein SAMN05216192_14630 [Paenibacillus typhae]